MEKIYDYYNVFHTFWLHIKATHPTWKVMEQLKEDSPWHRENSVAIHTEMVIAEFEKLIGDRDWTKEDMLGAFACAFHDFGKPSARVVKYKPERGNYNSFGGHELTSARMWEDYAVSNWKDLVGCMTAADIYTVGFLIEHHLPYDVKDSSKRMNFAQTVIHQLKDWTVFERVLKADTWGRISDDGLVKKAKVEGWIEQFTPLYQEALIHPVSLEPTMDETRTVFVLVGPSGCGKSSLITKMADAGDVTFSWDRLRLQWYGDAAEIDLKKQYRGAFERANEDKEFMNKANAEFTRLVKANVNKQDIFVDNTNLSAKRRRYFIDQARRNSFRVVGVVFPINLDVLKQRQVSRLDKFVPEEAVIKHYMNVQLPLLGEVDEVLFSAGNLIHAA
jgi:predicted kinase